MKKLVTGLMLIVLAFPGVAAAKGGAGTVSAPCGTLSAVSVTTTVSASGSITFKGNIKNCSTFIQRYWVDFSEPARPTSGGLNMPVTPCTTDYRLILPDYVGSGGSLAFTGSTTLTAPTTGPGCLGAHTVKVDLKSRTDGRLLSTQFVTFNVIG